MFNYSICLICIPIILYTTLRLAIMDNSEENIVGYDDDGHYVARQNERRHSQEDIRNDGNVRSTVIPMSDRSIEHLKAAIEHLILCLKAHQ